MEIIELERWRPSKDDPRKLEYAGQPVAQEVFEELKYRLESMGCLPDEYFLLDREWEDGREIPPDADVFCTVDYGASEGVYLDVYLKWYDDVLTKNITSSFITGKTLGENGNDLDRMFLTASAITKAFHGDHAEHARYRKINGVEEDTGGAVVHLSQREQRVIIEALAEQRERQETAMSRTEQLLRRLTGSITAYMDTVGRRPMYMSEYDRTVLAVRDGELDAFLGSYSKANADKLLPEAAGRPGAVGRRMTHFLLEDVERFPEAVYVEACRKAIDINDPEKVAELLKNAAGHVENLSPSFHGEMASYAFSEHRYISKEIIRQCSDEQVAAAPPHLLELFAAEPDFRTLSMLVEKGISGSGSAARTLHMLTYGGRNSWMAESLLEKRMWADVNDYAALNACVQNGAVDAAKLLLDGGMDLERYREAYPTSGSVETVRALEEHWAGLQAQEQEQDDAPRMGGMAFG